MPPKKKAAPKRKLDVKPQPAPAVGKAAPAFSLMSDAGEEISLKSLKGKNVVLYFYPKDFTPGCTAEACAFRDNYTTIAEHDAVIFGVSSDSEASHTAFRERHQLPFPLIADPAREVHRLYQAVGLIPWMPPRITYVIDRHGIIRAAIRHDFRVTQHVPEVIAALESINREVD